MRTIAITILLLSLWTIGICSDLHPASKAQLKSIQHKNENTNQRAGNSNTKKQIRLQNIPAPNITGPTSTKKANNHEDRRNQDSTNNDTVAFMNKFGLYHKHNGADEEYAKEASAYVV